MKIISLGWGVQSFTLAAMSALGELEPVDYAIHADTTHDHTTTYEFAERWTPWLEGYGVKVVTVKASSTTLTNKRGGIMVPAFNADGGVANRQCTGDWKINPMRRHIQSIRNGRQVEQWLGISLDEFQRMRQSNVKYIVNRYPLIEKRMTRNTCKIWLEKHGLEIPPRSSCIFCPFQSRSQWRDMRDNAPKDWEKAVEADHFYRDKFPPSDLFVNVQRKPLDECDLDNEMDHGQLPLWDMECSGVCGV